MNGPDGEDVEYLDLDDLLFLAHRLFGGSPPVRDVGLLGSAAARPQTTVFGDDAYVGVWAKAAALLQSLVKNHALVDGNTRLGWLATATFLQINGVDAVRISDDDVYSLVMDVAEGDHEVQAIAVRLRSLARGRDPRPVGSEAAWPPEGL